jgi:antitoxin HicB
MRYAVNLSDDEGTVLVTVPDIPWAVTFGEDREDALVRAVDAIETAIIGIMSAGEDIPLPKAEGAESVVLPALSAAKIELYRAMRADGVGKAALAKRLGIGLPRMNRLLDLRHSSRLDAMERSLAALNRAMPANARLAIVEPACREPSRQ